MGKMRFIRRKKIIDREKRIYTAHNIFVGSITAIILAGSVYAFLSISNFRSDIQKEMNLFKENLKTEIRNEIKNDLDIIKKEIQQKINEEFDRENIRTLVEKTVQERIDRIADELVRRKVEKAVTPKIREINNKVEGLFDKTELQLLHLEASNDSRPALDKLKELSLKTDYAYNNEAKKYYDTIYLELSNPVLYYPMAEPDEKSRNLYELTLDEIKDLFKKAEKVSRSVIQNELWFDNRFSFEQKMIFYRDIIISDKSIRVAREAAQIVINQNELTFNPMEWDKILSFLESKH